MDRALEARDQVTPRAFVAALAADPDVARWNGASLSSGLATICREGRLIVRFRVRAVLPLNDIMGHVLVT